MKWISFKEKKPPEETILVWGDCGIPHVGLWECGAHRHTECCYKNGSHFTGETIAFSHWMPLPKQPED